MNTDSIIASYARSLSLGQYKKPCPQCGPTRKKKSDPSLSLNVQGDCMVYKCHHCGLHGRYNYEEFQVQAVKPRTVNKEDLTDSAIEWLQKRGLSKETAESLGLYSTTFWINSEGSHVPCVAFPYTIDGQEAGAKIRSINGKGFSCTAPLRSFYNIDSIKEGDTVYIVEGEMDALTLKEIGIDTVLSVPNGAVAKVKDYTPEPDEDVTFSFLWEARDKILKADKIVIATDNDKNGKAMAEELARRIGKDRCWKIDYPEGYKDCNEVLIGEGPEVLTELVTNPTPWPVSGIYDAKHFTEQVMDIYQHGFGSGFSTGYEEVDEIYTVVGGQLTVVTGMPSSGKSEFIDQIMMNLADNEDLKFAICSFENEPCLHIAKLTSKYIGKPFFDGKGERVSPDERDAALSFINDHFTFLYQADGSMTSLDDIITRLKVAVMRHGISGAVIDPYNYISRPKDASETDWISEMLTRLRLFAQAHDIHIWFVAHPTKMPRNESGRLPVPKGNDISGSAAWFAKTDCGMTIHRPDPQSDRTQVHIWKCRFSWIGKIGEAELVFDQQSSQYRPVPVYRYIEPPKEYDPIRADF